MQKSNIAGKQQQKVTQPIKKPNQKPQVSFTYQNKAVNNMPKSSFPIQQTNNAFLSQQIQQKKVESSLNSGNFLIKTKETYQNDDQDYNEGNDIFGFEKGEATGLKLLKPLEKQKKIAAIIITFCGGGSYDQLFTSVQQKSMQGTQVLVYSCGNLYLPQLLKAFKGQPQDDQSKELMSQLEEVDADCVVFNWECCGAYTTRTFNEGKQNVFELLALIMNRGHMAMFSDFSLKALIKQWGQSNILGPNPFKQINQTSQTFQLRFKNENLKECPSAQLQIVGQMAQQGFCKVGVMGGTIVYTVDHNRAQKAKQYKLQILTVVTHVEIKQKNLICRIGDYQGAAGHVLLTFPKGGHILTSMGHWAQLMRIDTSQKKIFQIAKREYGQEYAFQMEQQYQKLDVTSKKKYVSQRAVNFVQSQAPCSNMVSKSNKSKKF